MRACNAYARACDALAACVRQLPNRARCFTAKAEAQPAKEAQPAWIDAAPKTVVP